MKKTLLTVFILTFIAFFYSCNKDAGKAHLKVQIHYDASDSLSDKNIKVSLEQGSTTINERFILNDSTIDYGMLEPGVYTIKGEAKVVGWSLPSKASKSVELTSDQDLSVILDNWF